MTDAKSASPQRADAVTADAAAADPLTINGKKVEQ